MSFIVRARRRVVVALFLWLLPTLAAAQAPHVYAGATFATGAWKPSAVSSGTPSTSYDNSSADQTVGSVRLEAGAFFARHGSVGIEWSVPTGRRELTSILDYFGTSERVANVSEQSWLGILRGEWALNKRFDVAIVGGGGIVREDARYRSTSLTLIDGHYTPGIFSAEKHADHMSPVWSIGGELVVAVARHVQIVPQLRALMIHRSVPLDQNVIGDLGLPRVMYRLGIGGRVAF